MKRRQFVQQAALLTAGITLLPAWKPGHSVSGKKKNANTQTRFIIAFAGSAEKFHYYLQCLSPLPEVYFIKMRPGRAIRKRVSAVFLETGLRHRIAYATDALSAGIPVILEAPVAEGTDEFSLLQSKANNSAAFLALSGFHRYLPAAIQARDIIGSNRLGSIASVRIQINDTSLDPLLVSAIDHPEYPILQLTNLARWILAENILAVSLSRNRVLKEKARMNRLMMFAYSDTYQIGLTNIPEFYGKDPGWTMIFSGNSGQMKLSANNRLEILDHSMEWEKLSEGKPEDCMTAVRMFIKDLTTGITVHKEPEVNSTDILADVLLYQAISNSLLTEKPSQMVELQIGRSLRL